MSCDVIDAGEPNHRTVSVARPEQVHHILQPRCSLLFEIGRFDVMMNDGGE